MSDDSDVIDKHRDGDSFVAVSEMLFESWFHTIPPVRYEELGGGGNIQKKTGWKLDVEEEQRRGDGEAPPKKLLKTVLVSIFSLFMVVIGCRGMIVPRYYPLKGASGLFYADVLTTADIVSSARSVIKNFEAALVLKPSIRSGTPPVFCA